MIHSKHISNEVVVLTLENDMLRVSVSPANGGRILGIYNKKLKKEFIWHNPEMPLRCNNKGDEYDVAFWGGIDELIPNDIPENVNGLSYPDHGELWTTPLSYALVDDALCLSGTLPVSRIYYERTIRLDARDPRIIIDYNIRNDSGERRDLLWKLHAALSVDENDRIISSAKKARHVYPDNNEKAAEFNWPVQSGRNLSVVPKKSDVLDFVYLYEIDKGEMKLETADGALFAYDYDKKVFPFQWCFASYGGFNGTYTVIFEPATNMPVSVNEAVKLGTGCTLAPGEVIKTTVKIYAGENKQYRANGT